MQINNDMQLLAQLRQITEQAALACSYWIGRGDKIAADAAAVKAMRQQIHNVQLSAQVLIGEGEKDQAPLLYKGEQFGIAPAEWHIAVDPLEGTTSLANAQTNAISVMTLCEAGKLFDPGNSFYMDKLVAPAATKGHIDPNWQTEQILTTVAQCLNKPVSELTVFVLNRPRNQALIDAIYQTGARIKLATSGDVVGALLAALPDGDVDLLLGIGGSPEGLLAACAVKSLGAEFYGRLAPQLATEKQHLESIGQCTKTWHHLDELVKSDRLFFSATGITHGDLLRGITREQQRCSTQSLCLYGMNNEIQWLTSHHASSNN